MNRRELFLALGATAVTFTGLSQLRSAEFDKLKEDEAMQQCATT